MGEGFYVLHDIPNPYGNVDHIVLSEHHGIFLLETKSHRGKVQILDDRLLVNGKPPEKDFIGQVLGNTYWLKEKLTKISGTEVWIAPILVFTNAFVAPLNKRIKNVTITNKKYLESLLKETRSTAASARVWEMREQITKTLIADQGR